MNGHSYRYIRILIPLLENISINNQIKQKLRDKNEYIKVRGGQLKRELGDEGGGWETKRLELGYSEVGEKHVRENIDAIWWENGDCEMGYSGLGDGREYQATCPPLQSDRPTLEHG